MFAIRGCLQKKEIRKNKPPSNRGFLSRLILGDGTRKKSKKKRKKSTKHKKRKKTRNKGPNPYSKRSRKNK